MKKWDLMLHQNAEVRPVSSLHCLSKSNSSSIHLAVSMEISHLSNANTSVHLKGSLTLNLFIFRLMNVFIIFEYILVTRLKHLSCKSGSFSQIQARFLKEIHFNVISLFACSSWYHIGLVQLGVCHSPILHFVQYST